MEDLDAALNREPDILFLGGGNPADIPEVSKIFKEKAKQLLNKEGSWEQVVGIYDGSQGNRRFLLALAKMFKQQFGWDVSEKNFAITNGSQNSFFLLFNLLAGHFNGGSVRQILLPMLPEYIGYADVGIGANLFHGLKPQIEEHDEHIYKYRTDFDAVEKAIKSHEISLVCCSRPTNPTGNVLTDDEIENLMEITRKANLPLLIDNAYGQPFPMVLFEETSFQWQEHMILVMSLSKLGIPGARTGIVLANEEIIGALTRMNAIVNLAGGSLGPALAEELVASGEITRISNDIIRPYYQRKAEAAVNFFREQMPDDLPYAIHRSEGAFFIWVWARDLPISDEELYQRLKKRKVLVVPGKHYFPGLDDDGWAHRRECIRVSFAQDDEIVRRGLTIIAEEIKNAYQSAGQS